MKIKMVIVLLVVLLTGTSVTAGQHLKFNSVVAGGTEIMLAPWTPGQGSIEPGGKIRGWTTRYQDNLIGPAAEFASGIGTVTMNCNLDESLTGSCWGTFELSNDKGNWVGAWDGSCNFTTGACSLNVLGYGQGGLKGMVIQNDVILPGYAVDPTGGGYIYSTVIDCRKHY